MAVNSCPSEITAFASESESKDALQFSVKIENPRSPSRNKDYCSSAAGSEITVKEFLDFLKTAYQVQDNLENTLLAEGFKEAVDWIKLRESNLVSCGSQTTETKTTSEKKERRKSDSSINTNENADPIKRKLSEVLSEGLLDSVLPYLVPATSQTSVRRVPLLKPSDKPSVSSNSSNGSNALSKKKSTDSTSSSKPLVVKQDSEVEIHVCDEVKNIKKDFTCNQKLLIEKMGYFAEVTTGQRLEDMDISVHCDIGIFDWLMRWVKKESLPEEELPELDAQCVIPVLVSAAFLKMEPLLEECLLYCHQHMNDILRTTTNLSCLNDTVLTRLAAMYTNTEIEAIRDRKDKIQSRLFIKLIRSLVEPIPESVRGHWNSLARVFRCGKCHQLVSPSFGRKIPCVPSSMQLQPNGRIFSQHSRDASWDIKEYIQKLLWNLKTWRKVYWRLWGDAHFLYCTTCKRYFPAHQVGWCRYHPDQPQFFTIDAQKAPLPIGRYPCCGDRAYRFQLLDNNSGCKFKEHTSCTKEPRDAAVLEMLQSYRHLIEEEPPQLMFPERLTRLVARDPNAGNDKKLECNEKFWWEGIKIIGPRPKLGLLGAFFDSTLRKNPLPLPVQESVGETSEEEDCSSSNSSSSSSQGSEESNPPPTPKRPPNKCLKAATPVRKKRITKKRNGRLWQHNLSARSNQDIQRAYEEAAMKKIASILSRRVSAVCADKGSKHLHRAITRHVTPPGGVWVRLEAEWRENNALQAQQKMRNIYNGKPRIKAMKIL